MERAVEGLQAAAYPLHLPRARFLCRRQRGRLWVTTSPRGRGGGARPIAAICFCMRAYTTIVCPVVPGGKPPKRGRVGIGGGGRGGGSGTKTAVDGPPTVPTARGCWTGLGPGPPRRAWAIGGGDASPASVRLRERGAPVAATPSCCGEGSTAGDGTSTHMAPVSPPVSAACAQAGGSPGAGIAVGAPSDGTDGGEPFVVELFDLDAATAARAA